MGGRRDRSNDIEMGTQGMWNSTSSEASSNGNDPKRNKGKTEADNTNPQDMEPNYQPINWKRVFLAPKYIPMWIILIIVGVLTAIITLKHDEVVAALRPFAEKVRNVPAGWLIFVAVLVIISFPPLFGHEVVALLAGVVYGLWIGFGVVSAGTFLGESEFAYDASCPKRKKKLGFGYDTNTHTPQSGHGSPSKSSFGARLRRWRGLTSHTAPWRGYVVMVDSGYVQFHPLGTAD
jgi:hypothetical protein